jgi:hypothetical protein
MQILPVLDVGAGEAGAVEEVDVDDVAVAEGCVAGWVAVAVVGCVAVAEGWAPVVDAEDVVDCDAWRGT